MTIISDGKGTGNQAQVLENRLVTTSVNVSGEEYLSHTKGDVFVATVPTATTTMNALGGANDGSIFYIKNTNTSQHIVIEELILTCSTASNRLIIRRGDTGTASGTSVTPANCNFGSNKTATCTVVSGSNTSEITGLTAGTELYVVDDLPANVSKFDFKGSIVLQNNNTLTVGIDNGAGADISGTVSCNIRFRFVDKISS